MWVLNSPGVFKENISKLFERFAMVYVYVGGLPVINKHNFADHMKYLETNFRRLN